MIVLNTCYFLKLFPDFYLYRCGAQVCVVRFRTRRPLCVKFFIFFIWCAAVQIRLLCWTFGRLSIHIAILLKWSFRISSEHWWTNDCVLRQARLQNVHKRQTNPLWFQILESMLIGRVLFPIHTVRWERNEHWWYRPGWKRCDAAFQLLCRSEKPHGCIRQLFHIVASNNATERQRISGRRHSQR